MNIINCMTTVAIRHFGSQDCYVVVVYLTQDDFVLEGYDQLHYEKKLRCVYGAVDKENSSCREAQDPYQLGSLYVFVCTCM